MENASQEVIYEAFNSDPRLKFVFCGLGFTENPWKDVSIFPFTTATSKYTGSIRFENNGDKVGFLMLPRKNMVKVEL